MPNELTIKTHGDTYTIKEGDRVWLAEEPLESYLVTVVSIEPDQITIEDDYMVTVFFGEEFRCQYILGQGYVEVTD